MSYDPVDSGYSGAPGESGYSGAVGPQGPQGLSGYSGAVGGPGTTDHAALSNLSYASANHTGFQSGIDWDVDYSTYLICH
jgi:hypothetical protein